MHSAKRKNQPDSIASPIPLYKYLLIAVTLFLLGGGTLLYHIQHERNIIFSGTSSAPVRISTGEGFSCALSCDTVPASGSSAFALSDINGNEVLALFPKLKNMDGKRKVSLRFKAGEKIFYCGTHSLTIDNPSGRFDFKVIRDDKGLLTVLWRERCEIYRSLFHKGGCEKLQLPDIHFLKLHPGCKADVKITTPAWSAKAENISGAMTVLFFIAGFFVLAGIAGIKSGKKLSASLSGTNRFAAGSFLFAILLIIVYALLPENMAKIPDVSNFLIETNMLAPEPEEQILYFSSLISFALIAIAVNKLLPAVRSQQKNFWYAGSCFLIWAGAVYLIFCEKGTVSGISWTAYFLTVILAMLLTAVSVFCPFSQKTQPYFLLLPAGLLLFYTFLTVKAYWLREIDAFDAHHYSVLLHPLWQSFHGISPLETYSTYGAYAFFTLPFFKAAGLDSTSVDLFWIGLILLTWFLLYQGTAALIKNRFRCCCAAAAIAGVSMIGGTAVHYAQYLPLRMIFPAMLFCWIAHKHKSVHSPFSICFGSILSCAAVVWNPDSGIVLWAAWSLYLAGIFFHSSCNIKLKAALLWLLSCIGTIAAISAAHYAVYNTFPDYRNLLTIPITFGHLGFYQLPMPVIGWWILPAACYLSVLIWTVGKLLKKKLSRKDSIALFTALLGCGLFGYYVGRSHWSNIFNILYPAFILIAWAAEKSDRSKITAIKAALTFVPIWFMMLGAASFICLDHDTRETDNFIAFYNKLCSDIENQIQPKGKLIYSGPWESLIAIEIKASPAFAYPAVDEAVFKKDIADFCRKTRSESTGAVWIVNMNYIRKLAPDATKKQIISEVTAKTKQIPRTNGLIFIKL